MNKTTSQLETEAAAFCARFFAPHVPDLRLQVISTRPVTVRVGVIVEGLDLDALQSIAADNHRLRAAWLQQWPVNMPGRRQPKTITRSAEDGRIIFDLEFWTVKLTDA